MVEVHSMCENKGLDLLKSFKAHNPVLTGDRMTTCNKRIGPRTSQESGKTEHRGDGSPQCPEKGIVFRRLGFQFTTSL